MKQLPKKIGKEIWLKPRYAILRFMNSGVAFVKKDHLPMICTFKPITEKDIGEQIQIHLRFDARDLFHKDHIQEQIDIDVYVSMDEWEKLQPLLKGKGS